VGSAVGRSMLRHESAAAQRMISRRRGDKL